MYRPNSVRTLRGLVITGIVTLASFLGGCSENSTEPSSPDVNPIGYPGTVKVSDPVPADEASSVRDNVRRNSADTNEISSDEAVQAVMAADPDAEILGVNLDYDRNEPTNYECVIRQNGKVYIVTVSRKDGTIISKEQTDNHYYTTVIVIKPTMVKCKEVKRKVKEQVGGDVIEINLEQIDDRPTYIIILLTSGNRYVTVYVDAESGKERKLKNDGKCEEEDDHDDGHKNHKGRGHYRHGKGHGYGHHFHCRCMCDDDDDNGTPGGDTTQTGLKIIPRDSARTIVSGMIDSARIVDIDLLIEDDSTAYYNVDLTRDSNRYEIKLDATTGMLVEVKQTSGNFTDSEFNPRNTGDTLVAMSVARTAALAQVAGTIQNWKLERDSSNASWMYVFEITAAGDPKKVTVDAKTGLVTKVE